MSFKIPEDTAKEMEDFLKLMDDLDYDMKLLKYKLKDICKNMLTIDQKIDGLTESPLFKGLPKEFKKQLLTMKRDTNEIKSKF